MRIMIIDDEPAIPIALQDFLEDMDDYTIKTANSGEEALVILKSFQAEVCIVDMRLPKMTGNEFILKAHALNPDTAFIIHTGSLDYVIPDELREIGLSSKSVIHKPVTDMDLFHNTIQKLAANKS